MSEQTRVRLEKIPAIREHGHHPYAERFERTHTLAEAAQLDDGVGGVRVAGRITALRTFGKLTFARLLDIRGTVQVALQRDVLAEQYKLFGRLVDVGDFVGVEGEMFTTRTGEKTVNVRSWTFLSKALRPLPEKWHGLADPELRLRRRYLDLLSSPEVRERFLKRTRIIRTLREFLDSQGFLEIDTPALTNKAGGAMARPFVTHNNALDIDVYLRIAPETYLKRAIAGGFDRVYEFARSFRNEGIDASHLPDFTLLEYYCAYWNYVDNMAFTETLMKHLLEQVNGSLILEHEGTRIDFGGEWPRVSFRELILRDCGIDIDTHETAESLRAAVEGKGIRFDEEVNAKTASRATLIDLLYKKVSRPKLVDPVFITHHPIDLSPLARSSDTTPGVVDRFQLVVRGWELVNAYSELVDPAEQARRFEQQAAARKRGDEEAMEVDADFLTCMEFGMPPISGWGMGIDRVVALLTNTSTLREVVLFPLLRPE